MSDFLQAFLAGFITCFILALAGFIIYWIKVKGTKQKNVKAASELKVLNTRISEVGNAEISSSIDTIISGIE